MFDLLTPYLYMATDDGGNGGSSGDPADDKGDPQGGDTQEIDWTKIDPNAIPETVLKNTKAYKDLLDESVDRRKTISKLKGDTKDKPQNQDNADQNQVPDEIKNTIKELTQTVQGLVKLAETQQTQTLAQIRQEAAEQYGLKSDRLRDRLQGSDRASIFKDAEEVAKELNIQPPPKQNGRVGNVTMERDKTIQNKVEARIRGANSSSIDPYSPDLHSALGGGIVDPYEE